MLLGPNGHPVADSLTNIVAGLGTERDKASHTAYVNPAMQPAQLATMYRASAIAKKIVDLPAEDSCREWREWQASGVDISLIEAEEKRLGLAAKVLEARKKARLFGGAAIYIGTGDLNESKPLNPERISKGGVKYLAVLGRDELSVKEIQRDPRLPGFNMPSMYSMAQAGQVEVHPSRVIVFRGEPHLDERFAGADLGWGDSVLTACISNVRDLDATMANVASLVFESKVDVLGIPDFMNNLQQGGQTYESQILRRASLAAAAKGINGMMLIDAEETYDQKSASFSALPNVIDRFMQMASAAASIPMTLLFGMSPAGLNATGDGDARGYYDRIKVEQSLEIEPAMALFDECLIRSALGERPLDLHYNWRPLWQPTAKERAETGKVLADTMKVALDTGTVPPEAVGKSLVNALTENGGFPSLEKHADEYFGENDLDPIEAAEIGDAAPKTLYVHRKVVNAQDIIDWAKGQGFKTTLPVDDLHVTVCFSRSPVDWMAAGSAWESEITIPEGGPRLMEQFGDARVLLFASHDLTWRHETFRHHGASWDHEEYQPHITISYDDASPDLRDIQPYTGEIILGPEIFQEVKEDWAEAVLEE